jgi:2-isopropylmalate synthase
MLVPNNYPVFGEDAFRTATGVHAAAIIKAKKKGDDWLADRIYSGVPAGMVGSHQLIEIGFMSGVSNVVHWLVARGIEPEQPLVEAIFRAAKERDRVMSEDEVMQIVKFVTEASHEAEPLPLDTIEGWKTSLRDGA